MPRRRPLPGRPDTWNWWLRAVMEAFYTARLLWDDSRETFSKGYTTEAAEYADLHPCPRLYDFLKSYAYRDRAASC